MECIQRKLLFDCFYHDHNYYYRYSNSIIVSNKHQENKTRGQQGFNDQK